MNRTTSIATLALLAVLGTGVTWFVQHTAAPRIAEQQRLLDSRHLLDMLAPDSYDNQPLEQPLSLADVKLAHSTLLGGYRATRSGKVIALLLRSQTLGYAGSIDLMIAIGPDGRLLAVKTLKHSETQGSALISPTRRRAGSGVCRPVTRRSGRRGMGAEKGSGAVRPDCRRNHHLTGGDQCDP